MIKFIKDSLRELKHVVWPTRDDTMKYFFIVLGFIVFFGLYLFIFSNIFGEFIIWLNKAI
nr:preprotein translocase subunit SecE [Candidatus Gracilibacteria bacterium]